MDGREDGNEGDSEFRMRPGETFNEYRERLRRLLRRPNDGLTESDIYSTLLEEMQRREQGWRKRRRLQHLQQQQEEQEEIRRLQMEFQEEQRRMQEELERERQQQEDSDTEEPLDAPNTGETNRREEFRRRFLEMMEQHRQQHLQQQQQQQTTDPTAGLPKYFRGYINELRSRGIIEEDTINLEDFVRLINDVIGQQNTLYYGPGTLNRALQSILPGGNETGDGFPRIVDVDGHTELNANLSRSVNVNFALFIYILYELAQMLGDRYYLLGYGDRGYIVQSIYRQNIFINDQHQVSLRAVMGLFSEIWSKFMRGISEGQYGTTEGSVFNDNDSAQVFYQFANDARFYIIIHQQATHRLALKWQVCIKNIMEESGLMNGLKTVMNETDNLCFAYSIVVGFCLLSASNFFSGMNYIEVNQLAHKVSLAKNVKANGKELMLRIKGRKQGDIFDRINLMDRKVMSTREISKLIGYLEDDFVTDKTVALDVYSMEMSNEGRTRVYPCYISRRQTDDRINLLAVLHPRFSHYFTVSNMKTLFKNTGDKIFETCEKCHQVFYTTSARMKHYEHCGEVKKDDWHWSKVDMTGYEEEKGYCCKCHLMFETEYEYEFHKKHCFMKNRSGSRYVCLAEEDFLLGEKWKEGPLESRSLFFADFESVIRENGEHEVMSYGIYNTEAEIYSCYAGEDAMEKFLNELESHMLHRDKMYVYFHNAMGYDANFILRYVMKHKPKWSISLLMKTSSRMQSMRCVFYPCAGKRKKKEIIIGDTFHFLTLSLDRIVSSIRKDDPAINKLNFPKFFKQFNLIYPMGDIEMHDIVLHKNLFPYKFFNEVSKLMTSFDDFEKIFEPNPENLKYFSETVTVEQLEANLPEFKKICEQYNVQTALDYHNIYLLCDVMELSDVFMKMRDTLHETHHIDVTDYVGMPAASWSAFLRFNPSLRLPMYKNTIFAEFFSSMTRGGVTSAPLRYAKADSKHSIIYLDVNGLYPFVMQKYLYPTGTFRWKHWNKSGDGVTEFFTRYIYKKLEREHRGACLCVDLHMPDEMKDWCDQFPFAPDHKVVKDEFFDESGEMYAFLKKWSKANNGEMMKPFIGLVGTLEDKKEYGVHWKLLKWYVDHGMIIKKIHFMIEFDESDYLKDYVQLNISIRNTRSDELGKMVYKLMGNSIYGKTFESPFNRCTYEVVRNREKLSGMLEEGGIAAIIPIDKDNCIVKLDAEKVILNKPTYIGACVTEYAKLHMYELFYDKLMRVFPEMKLVYTDTDSFIVMVEHEEGMEPKRLFEFIDSKCPGLFGKIGGQVKSETGEDDLIDEVIALRSKLYAYKTTKGKIGKRAKGTTAAAQETQLDWETYKQALFELKSVETHNMQFVRKGFKISTVEMVKQSISVNDGKRYICEDGVHTLAWGNPKIPH